MKTSIEEEKKTRVDNWDWRIDYVLFGSDVKALFPSLSASKTSKIVRELAEKTDMSWENLDDEWMRLYIHLNRDKTHDISEIEYLLLRKRKGRRGRESGITSTEAKEKKIRGNDANSCWTWPDKTPTQRERKKIIAMCLEIAINFFFTNFVYTFGVEFFLQKFGGPIGARLTMAVSRLVMQAWYDEFKEILKNSNIEEKLKGIYVDDGRDIVTKLKIGTRYNEENKSFEYDEKEERTDIENNETREKLTEKEMGKMMKK